MAFQNPTCLGGTCERHHISFIDKVQNVPRGSANELKGSWGQDAAFVNGSNHRFCQKRSHSRWLDNGRHPSHPIHGDLFEHAPNWKVECIDVDRHTLFWHQEMVSSKRALPSQRHKISIGGEWRVGKLPPKACIGKQVADAAFNVDPAVCSRGPCGPAHLVKVLFPFLKKQGQALEHSSSFLKSHFP